MNSTFTLFTFRYFRKNRCAIKTLLMLINLGKQNEKTLP